MGIFVLPTGASIPLHDHPGMIVVSRLLVGQLHVRSYDRLDVDAAAPPTVAGLASAARLVFDGIVAGPSEPQLLFPRRGNLHAFTSVRGPCVILDVLTPPYDPDGGRDCTYYRDAGPLPKGHAVAAAAAAAAAAKGGAPPDSLVLLEPTDPPADFVLLQGSYRGPHIGDSISLGERS